MMCRHTPHSAVLALQWLPQDSVQDIALNPAGPQPVEQESEYKRIPSARHLVTRGTT
jgi:hypothetical protein